MFAFAAEAAIALEITRRERQLRELQMQLAHTNIAALHFLDRNPPDLQEVREALVAAVKDADRVGAIVGRMRALMQKASPQLDRVDMNEALQEVIELTRVEAPETGSQYRPNSRKTCLSFPVIGSNFSKSSLTSFSTRCRRWAQLARGLDR